MATSKGYAASTSLDRTRANHVTVEPIRDAQYGESTVTHGTLRLVASDLTEATSDTYVITATSHLALAGDVIVFTSGSFLGKEVKVASVTTNTITLTESMASSIGTSVGFDILRHKYPILNPNGGTVVGGTNVVATARNAYATTNVTTGAWVQLVASTSATINSFDIYDSSTGTLELGLGAAASETRLVLTYPGQRNVPVRIPAGSRISIRAVSGTVSAGEIDLNFYA